MGTRFRSAPRVMADVGAGHIVAAFASLGAAAIHIASAADHFSQWWPAGVFFYAAGAFQAGWAVAVLLASGPAVMLVGLIANAGVIAIWAVSRTAGIPAGPSAGVPEGITQVGVTAVVFEAVICLVALWHVRQRTARGFASSLRAVVLIGAASAAVMGTTVPAVEGAMSHSHSHGGAEEPAPQGHGGDGSHEGGVAEPQDPHPGAAPDSDTTERSPAPSADEPAAPEPSQEPAHDEHGHDAEPHEH